MRRWIPIVIAAVVALTTAVPAEAGTASKAVDCARVKCIALTFDDGPGPYTAKLLDTLRRHRTKVTFFLIGQHVEKYGKVVRRMAREGHEIGNHTYTHPHLTSLPVDEIRDEISHTQDLIHHATGKEPTLLRPPYGDTDDQVTSVAAELGLSQILWNGSSHDWELRNTRAVTAKVLGLAKRDRVILMHDIWPETVKAVPQILNTLEKRGYHVVPVTSLLRGRELGAGEIFPIGGWN